MKKIQKIASIFMSLGVMLSVAGCRPYLELVDPKGRWYCRYTDETRTECAVGDIIGDWGTDVFGCNGELQYAFYPTHIAGVPVTTIGFSTLMNAGVGKFPFSGGKYFLPYTVREIYICASDDFYVSGKYFQIEGKYKSFCIPKAYESYYKQYSVYFANVVYDINYENEEYQYHSVDNYKYGSLIEIVPPDPEREGYTFDGWYKESECVNEWDFETDTLPEEIKDESGEVLFQETALYAKWIRYT